MIKLYNNLLSLINTQHVFFMKNIFYKYVS